MLRAVQELLVFLDDKVLVLVHDMVCDISDAARIMFNTKAVLWPLRSHESAVLYQAGSQSMSQILQERSPLLGPAENTMLIVHSYQHRYT